MFSYTITNGRHRYYSVVTGKIIYSYVTVFFCFNFLLLLRAANLRSFATLFRHGIHVAIVSIAQSSITKRNEQLIAWFITLTNRS